MTPYYKAQLERGLCFQDFVYEILHRHGITTVAYGSKLFQLQKGENKAGIEIKFDDKMAETGNLYIEVAEKADPKNAHYVSSGIYRESTEYVIGNYDTIYRLAVSTLRILHETHRYQEKTIPTSKGFLLPIAVANRFAIAVLYPNSSAEMQRVLSEAQAKNVNTKQLMAEMVRKMKCDPNQMDLFANNFGDAA